MGPVSKSLQSRVIREDGVRMIVIPEEIFLIGEEVTVRQERDGTISIHPAEEHAREELWARFNPFVEWENETWPVETPKWDIG
ncbi:hypothetical protein [Rhizobium sp. 18055]|jgi:hypothetical protein|uniref:hypothetical protein n=1 Tax=Rhizobium sp. 18055 TaxID=2681403 RepID=UPI00135AF7C7|nr:hypothetical protein [Rhizobium sp. 18055]